MTGRVPDDFDRADEELPYETFDPHEAEGLVLTPMHVQPNTNLVHSLVVLDWTFRVYGDGSMTVETPVGRENLPVLKIALHPTTAAALRALLDRTETTHQALESFGPVDPGTLGRAG